MSECDIHIQYLERIIHTQKDEIAFLRTMLSGTPPQYRMQATVDSAPANVIGDVDVSDCIFDIIDHKSEEMDIDFILSELNNKFPAKQNMMNIIAYFITDKEYHCIVKRKNDIKYIDQNNKVQLTQIPAFAKTVCLYLFEKLKPVIESKCTDLSTCENDTDSDYEANNIRVENIMILRNDKMYGDLMKQVLQNHF
jgi:hypothetical protein